MQRQLNLGYLLDMSIRIRVAVTPPNRMANTGQPVAFKKE